MLGYIIRSRNESEPLGRIVQSGTVAALSPAESSPRSIAPSLPSPRSMAFQVLASLIGIFGVLFALEAAMRVWIALFTPNIMVLDPALGWRHRANLHRTYYTEGVAARVQTYEHGLRTPLPKADDHRPRVLIIGDSFVDGLEVSDADHFVTRWSQARPDLALVNAGVGGYSTVQETMWLDELLPVVKPDRIMLIVDRSDLIDNVEPFYAGIGPRPYANVAGAVAPLSWEGFRPLLLPIPGAAWLHANSVLAYVVRNRFVQSPWGARIQEVADAANRAVPDTVKRRILAEAIARVSTRGIPVTTVVTARKDTVRQEGPSSFSVDADVNLAEVLRPEHFYVHDIHWNVAGHAAVAARLSQLP